jgi:hypothetical protein
VQGVAGCDALVLGRHVSAHVEALHRGGWEGPSWGNKALENPQTLTVYQYIYRSAKLFIDRPTGLRLGFGPETTHPMMLGVLFANNGDKIEFDIR